MFRELTYGKGVDLFIEPQEIQIEPDCCVAVEQISLGGSEFPLGNRCNQVETV